MKKSLKLMPAFLMPLICLMVTGVNAEMVVTTHDGQVLRLPVNGSDVKKIEYTRSSSAPVTSGSRYIGCFADQTDVRDLGGYTFNNGAMTTSSCISTCNERGFKYASTQFGSHCFCGNSYGRYGASTNCNMPCSGKSSEICGGGWANSVYRVQ